MVISEYCHGSPRGLLARIPLRSPSQRYPQGALPRSLYPQGGLQSFLVLSMGRHCEYGTDINPCCTSGRSRSSATCAYSHTNHAWSKRSTHHGSRKCPSVGCLGCNRPRAYARCQRLTQTAPYLRWAKLPTAIGHTRLVSESPHHNFSHQPKKHLCFAFVHFCINDCPHDVDLMFPVPTAIGRARHY